MSAGNRAYPASKVPMLSSGKPNLDGMGAGQNEVNQFTNPVNPEGFAAGKTEAKTEQPKVE